MKNIKKSQKQIIESAALQRLDNDELRLNMEILEGLYAMRMHLVALEHQANALLLPPPDSQVDSCLSVPVPTLSDLQDKPSIEELRHKAKELLASFFERNRTVWLAEEVFEPPTLENKPVRALGKKMHAWYEHYKRIVIQPLGLYASKECADPTFIEIFQDAMKRAFENDPIAIEYLHVHWGLSLSGDDSSVEVGCPA
jgi:hypothetical protein